MEQAQAEYVRAMEQFGQKVHAIRDDQWAGATPCTEWSVRDLVNHVTYESLWAPDLMAGKTVAEVGDGYDGDNLGADPLGAWDRAAAAAVATFSADGALDRKVDSSMGPLPGPTYLEQLFLDVVIHGWDLARGIEADDTIEPSFVDQLYAEVAPKEDDFKAWGVFGGRVVPPEGADTQTKLLAVLGRVQ
jgi:uncharacterized protein (TIGR03086 family)